MFVSEFATAEAVRPDLSKVKGVILYQGPSLLDGSPIVVVATGINDKSSNKKTGAMVQTYIIRSDVDPLGAAAVGADAAVCGDCPHRGRVEGGKNVGRSCYVVLAHGPLTIWKQLQKGAYPAVTPEEARRIMAGKMVRLGTYGDPTAMPSALWRNLLADAEGWTGYTHQWRKVPGHWAKLVMASADSVEDMNAAHALGYRTFRVTAEPFANVKGKETVCPASEEKGKVADCFTCRACMGTSGKARVSIQIAAHGGGKKHVATRLAA